MKEAPHEPNRGPLAPWQRLRPGRGGAEIKRAGTAFAAAGLRA